jgi:hypothetical protein
MLPLVAGLLALGVDLLYLVVIRAQGVEPGDEGRVVLVAGSLAAAVVLGCVGAFSSHRLLRVALLSFSASALLIWAFLGAFSIGALLLVPALLMVVALGEAWEDDGPSTLVALLGGTTALAVITVALTMT